MTPISSGSRELTNTIWKIDRVAELLDRARMQLQGFENFTSAERIAQHQAALKRR